MQVDVVVPVPETSRVAAMHCAARLGLPFEEGLTKNRQERETRILYVAFRFEHGGGTSCGRGCSHVLACVCMRPETAAIARRKLRLQIETLLWKVHTYQKQQPERLRVEACFWRCVVLSCSSEHTSSII